MNFEWLNEMPASGWTQDGNKLMRQVFPLAAFKKKSAVVDDPGDSWKSALDKWGNAQPQKYRHFSPPQNDRAPTILLVRNKD
jgi:hypothetical protein